MIIADSTLIISAQTHIDVPLYAIPGAEFMLMEKAVQARTLDGALDSRADSVDRWDALPSDCVLLAHREEGWKASDPRKIHDWFVDAVELYGERLRRVCRYLKAWRDHNRPHLDGVSSISHLVLSLARRRIGSAPKYGRSNPTIPGRKLFCSFGSGVMLASSASQAVRVGVSGLR